MNDDDEKDALEEARREGALQERARSKRRLTGIAAFVLLLGVLATALGYTITVRAQEATPRVMAAMAAERSAAVEQRLRDRTTEARQLLADGFGFVELVWRESPTLRRMRANVDTARTQAARLADEVRLAIDAPSDNLGTLLENGPTRAQAVFDQLAAIMRELQTFVPRMLTGLGDAADVATADHQGTDVDAILLALDELVKPLLEGEPSLEAKWSRLSEDVRAWTARVKADFAFAESRLSGENASEEFFRRLRQEVF